MRIEKASVACAACGLVQEVEIVVDAPLVVTAESLKAARCSACESRKLLFRGEVGNGE